VELEAIEFDLLKLAEDLVELLSPLAQKKNLVLACFARPELPRCMVGDPNRIRQVLTNLMGNAMKFTGMGQITIRTSLQQMDARQMTVRMEVQDTGMGIPADRLDRLFKSFSQVDSSTTRKFGGTGLGLAICKRLVELMGGEIGVESQSGKGTTFWFTVKLAVAAGNSEAASDQTEKLRNLRVLAVEPDATQRKILAEHLDGFFFASEIAASVDEAIEKLNRGMRDRSPFDVALVRYDQPGAADYVQRIRVDAVASQTKSIAMLETDDATDEARISAAGFAAQVRYPLMRSRIFDAISTVIVERPKARVALQGKPESASTLNGLHLLVAEDNEMNQFVTQETLRRFGCTCEIVSDGSQAIEAMQQKKFDAVLMDCQMPVLDGLEATRRIREKEQVTGTVRIPIIALTAEAIQGDREKCLAVGMDGYVTKPINAKGLFSAISALVRPRESVLPPPVTAEAPVQNADAPADVETPPIQVESLLARCMQDADFARRTLEQFEKRTIEDVHRLERSIAEADAHLINRLAHNLKSVAAHVGAEKLRAIAFEIEQAGARCDLSMIEAQLGALCLEAQRCTEFIPQAISRLTQTGQAVRKP
jgi:Amt family ammonium transporter